MSQTIQWMEARKPDSRVPLGSERLTLGFLADVLYIKGVICAEEFEDIQDVAHASELEDIVEKMLRGDYNVYKRGEARSAWDGQVKIIQGSADATSGGYTIGIADPKGSFTG